MKIIRPIFVLSFLIYFLLVPYEIFATNDKNVINLERSRELLLDGFIQSEFDNHQLAIEYFTEAIRLNPKNFFAFLNRAYSKHEIKDIAGAWDDLNIALEIDPDNGIAFYNRAIVNWKLGHQLGSIKDYSKAINKNIKLKNAYAVRGILKSNIGDAEGACADWQKASENKNERATLWVQENCLPNISEDFKRKTENKVLISNARRKYLAKEYVSSCDYYELAKSNGYKPKNLKNKFIQITLTETFCFFF